MLGLPDGVTVCLFDLDGVLSQTAVVHAAAWKQTFEELLRARGDDRPFSDDDYNTYVDGKPREDGVRDFLASRGIHLPEGTPEDGPDTQTVWGVGNRKNELLLQKIHDEGVDAYPGSVRYVQAAREAGFTMVCVSSSANAKDVLDVTGLSQYLDGRVDGVTRQEQHLAGKPAPDTFLAGARLVGAEPSACAVFEDAVSGVQAGRAGRFGYVVGVDRVDHAAALTSNGADVVVKDLEDLL